MAAGGKTEVHHRIPRSLLAAHDRMTVCGELDGAALQAWFDFEEECHSEIHAADWARWGWMGGLRVLELYGPAYFANLARRRWRRITAEELTRVRERLRQAREAAA